MELLYAFPIVIFLFIIQFLFETKTKKAARKFIGPPPLPFIGNAHQALGNSLDFFKTLCSFGDTYGSKFRAFIGHHLFVILSDPVDAEALLSSNVLIEKSAEYDFVSAWLGTGLLISSGDKWRKRRKVITPTFHFKILEHFIEVFNGQGDILLKKMERHIGEGPFDIFPDVTLCALDIISEAAMGVSINAQNQEDSSYVKAVKDMCRILNGRMKNPLKRADFLFKLSSDYRLQKKSLAILHDYTSKMIQERKRLLNDDKSNWKSYTNDEEDNAMGIKKKMAFLDMLILSTIDGKSLSDLDIREEVDTFLFEGHDTTTSGIAFSLYLIAHNPEVQEKLYQEQKDIFGSDFERKTTSEDLVNMKYLELAIKESLRLYPPVPIIARKILSDSVINGMELPAQCTVAIFIFRMNRNPEVFPDPLKFVPERFLAEEANKRNPFSTVSFSAGPRNCIGQKFAMLEMKCTIAKVLRKYELLPSNEEVQLTADLILKPVDGAKIVIAPRKR